ncbi:MAG TPA: hypothetical protein VFG20_07055 [Planctomycetaceae bacterium]|nr:hypothetical protein [Planctomycetaceae bacterium]
MTSVLLLAVTLAADPWITGPKAAVEWDRPLTAVFENAELRDMLRKLGPERHLAVILDRRIDPNQTVAFTVRQESLRSGLSRFAESVGAEFVLTENVAYFGPPDRARWLRTLIVQAEREFSPDAAKRPTLVRKTIAWDDLTSPREIVDQIAEVYNIRVENPERIPHDLWAGATLPSVTVVEALALVLIQLDLGWTCDTKSRRITLIDWHEPELIERTYPPRGKATVASQRDDWQARWPELSITARENDLVVRGRVEDHEQIARTLSNGTNRVGRGDAPAPTALSQRRFTLNEKNVPARAVLNELEKSGAEIVLDQDSLDAAGADLDRAVSIQVQKATIAEFLQAVLGSVNAVAEVDGLTITVRGKR